MSLTKVIPYLRETIEGMGFEELHKEFNDLDVAGTVMDRQYRITPGNLTSGGSSSLDYEWTFPLEIEIFVRGYRKTSDAVDGALLEMEKFMDAIFEVTERYSQDGIRDIFPNDISFEQFAGDNDSIVKCKMGLTAKIHIYNSKDCL